MTQQDFSNLGKTLLLYSIHDKKTNEYTPPFGCFSEAEAVRQFSSLVNYSESLMCKFPSDYTLEFVGLFDLQCGQVFEPATSFSINGAELKTEKSQEYTALFNEVKKQASLVGSLIQDYEKIDAEYKKQLRELNAKSVELFPVEKETNKTKVSIIDKLFRK